MKKILLLVAIVALALVGWYWYANDSAPSNKNTGSDTTLPQEYALMLNDGSIGVLRYLNDERNEVFIRAYDATHTLYQAQAASGIRFVNELENIQYREHQGQATLTVDGEEFAISRIEPATIVEMNIAAEQQTCNQTSNQCLVVNGELFDERIEGFDYQEGNTYDIIVARTTRDNVQGDTPAYRYRLVEVLSKQAETSQENAGSSTKASLLEGTSWQWQETNYANGRSAEPDKDNAFVARFGQNGQFSSTTDCNSISGNYEEQGETLSFNSLASTLMACMGETQEASYTSGLGAVTNFSVDGDSLLLITSEKAVMTFARINDSQN